MVQKVIKIGTSAGITIPKKQLEELGISIGDSVEFTITKKVNKPVKHAQLIRDLEEFMNIYDQDLKNLANR